MPEPGRWAHIIIHADLDAFFASVEQLDRPELRGKPVVVGGPPEARGVVAAASYEARKFGVHSATPMSRALRLCPQAVRVSPRFDRYGELSRQVMAVFYAVTPLVEPLSMDEAFLDVTDQAAGFGGPEELARWLKREVRERTGLTLSIGVGTNKTVAKIGSDAGKPDGLVVVPPGEEAAFLAPLPVRALWGVGPKTEEVLRAAGFQTVGQIAAADAQALERVLRSWGTEIRLMAQGIDTRAVVTEHERKSVGAETTFPRDLADGPELRAELSRVAADVARRLRKSGTSARTVVLKLRYSNFKTITRQASRPEPVTDSAGIEAAANALLDKVLQDASGSDGGRPPRFRLLGIHATKLAPADSGQLALWQANPEDSG